MGRIGRAVGSLDCVISGVGRLNHIQIGIDSHEK